jgi:hypothetical protein
VHLFCIKQKEKRPEPFIHGSEDNFKNGFEINGFDLAEIRLKPYL